MVGPPLGGLLYALLGYSLTLVSSGLLMAVPLAILAKELLKERPAKVAEEARKGSILQEPACVVILAIGSLGLAAIFYCFSYLMIFLHEAYGVVEWQFGLAALGSSAMFIVASMFVEPLSKAYGASSCFAGGFAVAALGYVFLGPSSLIPFALPLWGSLCAWYTITLGAAVPLIQSSPVLLAAAMKAGFSEEDASVQTATINVFTMGVGMMLAPGLGGFFADHAGVGGAGTIGAFGLVFVGGGLSFALKALDKKAASAEMV